MVLDDLLDLAFHLGRHGSTRDFFEEGLLRGREVSTELAFPAGDLLDGDVVKLEWRLIQLL